MSKCNCKLNGSQEWFNVLSPEHQVAAMEYIMTQVETLTAAYRHALMKKRGSATEAHLDDVAESVEPMTWLERQDEIRELAKRLRT